MKLIRYTLKPFRVLIVYGRDRVPPFDLSPNFLDASYVPDKIDLMSAGHEFVSKHTERYSTVGMFVKDDFHVF